jgi:hypothetical protein
VVTGWLDLTLRRHPLSIFGRTEDGPVVTGRSRLCFDKRSFSDRKCSVCYPSDA